MPHSEHSPDESSPEEPSTVTECEPTNIAASETIQRHPLFFIEPIFIKVQNTLFQVPRLAFEGREGSPFADAASLQAEQEDHEFVPEGRSIDKPVVLHVEVRDFENLLSVMAASALMFPTHSSNISNEQWKSALRLSNMWNFVDIRAIAIEKLDDSLIDPIERIVAAREFRVRRWLFSSLEELITGGVAAIDPARCANTLGWETVALLYYARSEYRTADPTDPTDPTRLVQAMQSGRSRVTYSCPFCHQWHKFGHHCTVSNEVMRLQVEISSDANQVQPPVTNPELQALIERIFADELNGMHD
ncbi:hypothetical protein BJ165DRAFT_1406237 [Panaeolus papilionaceus]|nr:hypothetical protein BJ165DRAFT_1406237 [Panaeolus papilionaceus]